MTRSASAPAKAGALLNCLWTVRTVANWMALGICAYIQYLSLSMPPFKNDDPYRLFTLQELMQVFVFSLLWMLWRWLYPHAVSSKAVSLWIGVNFIFFFVKLTTDVEIISFQIFAIDDFEPAGRVVVRIGLVLKFSAAFYLVMGLLVPGKPDKKEKEQKKE